ncbi:MAG: hypothetical protein ABSA90_01885 [Xanthobacteraceae bacterium]|jgi:hypothetical protein
MSAKIIQFPRSKLAPISDRMPTTRSRVDELRAELNAVLAQGTANGSFKQSRETAIDDLFASVAQIHARVAQLNKYANDGHIRHSQHR